MSSLGEEILVGRLLWHVTTANDVLKIPWGKKIRETGGSCPGERYHGANLSITLVISLPPLIPSVCS